MTTTAHLDPDRVELIAGVPATCQLTVTNHSPIVEGYDLVPVGDLAPWMTIEPATLTLYPEAESPATVRFVLPEDATVPAGPVPFGVVVQPRERPQDRVAAEAMADVARHSRLTAELTPVTAQSRLWSRHSVAVDNRGNYPVDAAVEVSDPDEHFAIRRRPGEVHVAPGQAAFVSVRARHRKLLWRGAGAMTPLQVLVTPSGETQPIAVTGRVMQEPILSVRLAKPLALLCAAVLALVALWFALLRPTVKSTAQDAVAKPVAQAKQAKQDAEQAGNNAGKSAKEAQKSAKQATAPPATPTPTPTPTPTATPTPAHKSAAPRTTREPFNRRLTVSAAPGATATAEFVVPAKQTLSVTDLVFQSTGDQGTVRLLRDTSTLITAQPQDFRTLDEHFVSPFVYTAGQRLVLQLSCSTPAQGNSQCGSALYVGGQIEVPAHRQT